MRRLPLVAFVAVALGLGVGLAAAVSPYASSSPDGLEKVADDKGFRAEARMHALQDDAPAPAYAFPSIENERLATGVAGLVGTFAVFALALAIAFVLGRARRRSGAPGHPA